MVRNRRSNERVAAVLRPPLEVIVFVVKGLYKVFFGWADKLLAKKQQGQLERDVNENLAFLFDECGGKIIPNEGIRFPPGFDYAVVTIAVGELLVRFIRGRGELDVEIAPKSSPQEWHALSVAISALNANDQMQRESVFFLSDVASGLKASMGPLQEAFSKSQYPTLRSRFSEFDAYERAAMKQLATEINRRLYS